MGEFFVIASCWCSLRAAASSRSTPVAFALRVMLTHSGNADQTSKASAFRTDGRRAMRFACCRKLWFVWRDRVSDGFAEGP